MIQTVARLHLRVASRARLSESACMLGALGLLSITSHTACHGVLTPVCWSKHIGKDPERRPCEATAIRSGLLCRGEGRHVLLYAHAPAHCDLLLSWLMRSINLTRPTKHNLLNSCPLRACCLRPDSAACAQARTPPHDDCCNDTGAFIVYGARYDKILQHELSATMSRCCCSPCWACWSVHPHSPSSRART